MADNENDAPTGTESEQVASEDTTPVADAEQTDASGAQQTEAENVEPVGAENTNNDNEQADTNGDGVTGEEQTGDATDAEKKPEDGGAEDSKEDKDLEEGSLINATEDNDAKMFVGGLSWDTETFSLREYFSEYGKVRDCTIKKDSKTERSRGFGFVLFEDPASVDAVLKIPSHHLDGRKIDPKRAEAQRKDGKMFVGGISTDTEDDTIKTHFSQYGEIEVYERPTDKQTGKKRGFCFITFKKDGVLKQAIANKNPEIDGKTIDVKEAVTQLDRGNRFMGRGGGGMGRGGWGGPQSYGGGGYRFGGGGYGGGYDGYSGGYGGYGGGFGGYGNNYSGYQGGYGGGGKGLKGREGLGRRRGGGWGDTRTHTNHTNWYGHRGNFHGAYQGFHDY